MILNPACQRLRSCCSQLKCSPLHPSKDVTGGWSKGLLTSDFILACWLIILFLIASISATASCRQKRKKRRKKNSSSDDENGHTQAMDTPHALANVKGDAVLYCCQTLSVWLQKSDGRHKVRHSKRNFEAASSRRQDTREKIEKKKGRLLLCLGGKANPILQSREAG